uniref:CSON014699 protein n=1 Tax=Culicoides sonorensis TaxID=179676 RepID=A0A336KUU5_CULSO
MEVNTEELLMNFPIEMLIEIFRYLSETDITESVIYVCKRWLDAAKHLRPMKSKCLSFTTRPPPADCLEMIRKSEFRITSINLNDPIFELFPIELWKELGKTTEIIRFNRCTALNERDLIVILKYFPKLNSLYFRFRFPSLSRMFSSIDMEPDALQNLEKINSLNLNSNIWMDMSKVEQLVSRMPNLRHFGLWCLGITPVNDIMKVIKRQAKSLKSLSLRHCRTNNATVLMEKLTQLQELELEKLTFSISWISEAVVRDFFTRHNKVKILQLGTSIAFFDSYFDFLLKLEHLRELNVDVIEYQHTYHILKRFFELPCLVNLSLERETGTEHTKCIGIHEIFTVKRLEHLRMTYFNVTCRLCIENFCKTLKNLKSLSITSSNITNDDMSLIFEHMQNLQSLDISRCERISDISMTGHKMISHEKKMKINNFTLKSMKRLKYLNLSGCTNLTDATFIQDDMQLLDLKHLNVGCIPNLTTAGFDKISQNFHSLESLQIYGNPNVDGAVLEVLLKNLTRLKEIDISKYSCKDGCEPFESNVLEILVKFGQKLKTIIILQRKLLKSQIIFLFQSIPSLMVVNDVTRTRLKAGGDLDMKKMESVPHEGEVHVIEESFLKVLEQIRDKNPDFMKEPINLSSFLV